MKNFSAALLAAMILAGPASAADEVYRAFLSSPILLSGTSGTVDTTPLNVTMPDTAKWRVGKPGTIDVVTSGPAGAALSVDPDASIIDLSLSNGKVVGTPTLAGPRTLTVKASAGGVVKSDSTIVTVNGILAAAPASNPYQVLAGGTVSLPMNVSGVVGQQSWAYTAGSATLPTGLNFSQSTGLITGTAGVAGSHTVALTLTDGDDGVSAPTGNIAIEILASRQCTVYNRYGVSQGLQSFPAAQACPTVPTAAQIQANKIADYGTYFAQWSAAFQAGGVANAAATRAALVAAVPPDGWFKGNAGQLPKSPDSHPIYLNVGSQFNIGKENFTVAECRALARMNSSRVGPAGSKLVHISVQTNNGGSGSNVTTFTSANTQVQADAACSAAPIYMYWQYDF